MLFAELSKRQVSDIRTAIPRAQRVWTNVISTQSPAKCTSTGRLTFRIDIALLVNLRKTLRRSSKWCVYIIIIYNIYYIGLVAPQIQVSPREPFR